MACSNCSPEGCGNKGHCGTGGCNKMNTHDWISTLEISDPDIYNYVEVSFKLGSRKEFLLCDDNIYHYHTGDMVVVDCAPGYDVGQISLMGEMVRLQMKKKSVSEHRVNTKIIRKANERDLEKLEEARSLDKSNLVKARAIARSCGVDLKLGDIEYQADLKKATFYYTANGRIDFRELVREYAREFKIKVEMRQIGSRQESARIGGIGSCGRELCCSTWLSDFKSVNTSAARYQNIAINQTKLSGQCGRLKCCLNYELDTYLDALQYFPQKADTLITKKGKASLIKTDIFKGILYYSYDDIALRGAFHPIDKDKVKIIQSMNAKGVYPDDFVEFYEELSTSEEEKIIEFEDVTGAIELPVESKRSSRNKRSKGHKDRSKNKGHIGENKSSRENKNKEEARSEAEPKPPRENRLSKSNNKPKNQGQDASSSNKPADNSSQGGSSRRNNRSGKSRYKGKGRNNPPQGSNDSK